MAFALLKHSPVNAYSHRGAAVQQSVRSRRHVVVHYRSKEQGAREVQGSTVGYQGNVDMVLYTATDPVHGGPCPYSQAVIMALLEKKVPFKEVKVDLGNKPAEFKELYHSIIPDREERVRVPVLLNGNKRLVDSSTIVEYLAAAYPESGTPLMPPDAFTAARVKLFSQYFADHVVPAYRHLIKVDDPKLIAEAKEGLMKALAAVDEFLALHGAGGEYAVGPHYGWSMSSLADAAEEQKSGGLNEHFLMGPFYTTAEVLATPFVERMVDILPEWRDMDVMAECDKRKLHRVAGWMKACLSRPSAQLTRPKKQELMGGLCEWEWSHAV